MASNIVTPTFPQPTENGIAAFLASSFVPGIGKIFARRIVDMFGLETLHIIVSNPKKLESVQGISKNKSELLVNGLKEIKYPIDMLAFLFSCELSGNDILKIISHYRTLTPKVILYDPYEMVEDVWKLSFFTADKIGKRLGFEPDDLRRLKGAVLTAIKIFAENGNIYANEHETVELASRIAGTNVKNFNAAIESLIQDGRIIRSHNGLYLPVYYKAEKEGAEKIAAIVKSARPQLEEQNIPTKDISGNILSPAQRYAIETVINHPVTVITGGPGTGKTTAILGIIETLEAQGKKIVLTAPTGRAAKRMTELTGMEAMTIHRLLGHRPGENYRNKSVEADILIIDEGSMLEQVIFNHLLQSLKQDTKIVIVGDVNQLPSIGAGDVLKELISSGTVPVISLNDNFRQKKGSKIAANAEAIRNGITPIGDFLSDFMIIQEENSKKIHDRIINLVSVEIPSKHKISSKDILVVTPQQDGPLGAKQLNIDIQEKVNPNGPTLQKGLKKFRMGDRVMQTSNSSQRNIYNGEIGIITNIDLNNESMEVTFFDGKKSIYRKTDLSELTLAYATTVHKMQGSETDYMIMPVTMVHRNMLYRNLLYTAVSRAKKLCVLVGEDKAIQLAVGNNTSNLRNTNFGMRLKNSLSRRSA